MNATDRRIRRIEEKLDSIQATLNEQEIEGLKKYASDGGLVLLGFALAFYSFGNQFAMQFLLCFFGGFGLIVVGIFIPRIMKWNKRRMKRKTG